MTRGGLYLGIGVDGLASVFEDVVCDESIGPIGPSFRSRSLRAFSFDESRQSTASQSLATYVEQLSIVEIVRRHVRSLAFDCK